MKVATWNIQSNSNLSNLGTIAQKADVICLQEIHGQIIESWGLQKSGKYYIGKHKIGRDDWDVLYWNNTMTINGTMGLAIISAPTITIEDRGVYTFNASQGSHSETRGLPWLKCKDKDNKSMELYSFHSSSNGNNNDHRNKVNLLMTTMMDKTNQATFGDFNMTADYYAANLGAELTLFAGNVPTRIISKKILDYCVCKSDINIVYIETMTLGGSDHQPVVFNATR
ncbi:hypothetical protein A8139_17685 [Marinomonas primoryensis]|uniref:Endonuclease/exonuclease/phosphatase domain-containing protein n=1 Tax=Marinomonas primoryensis TaxID=178399 RepID=A0A2Z4PVJ5_9GAMM|nr:endonuclease/exonuclease/phosphatase family protein [Marinomonas primoryensis]AWY01591.1 hypothetical protein A8139_17685 [Marinomonas primoryensis]